MAENELAFRRVREAIYYRKTSKLAGEIVPGIWERTELVERMGVERVEALERVLAIEPIA